MSTRTATAAAPAEHRTSVGLDWAGPIALTLRTEADVQAACGIMHVHGRRYGEPTALPLDYCARVARLLAAHARLAAQCSMMRGRPISRATTSVAQAALLVVGQYLAAATAGDEDYQEPHTPGGPPFRSGDGVRFEIESLAAEGWAGFWRRLGAPDRAAAAGWRAFEHRFASAVCPLPAQLAAAASRNSFLAAARAARDAGIGIAAVRDAPGNRTSGPDAIPFRIVAADAADRRGRAAPVPRPSASLAAGPLHGFTVVESTRRIQGPLAGHLLRQLGARVVRIEPPGGDPLRGTPPIAFPPGAAPCSARFHALNRGKQVVEADLATAAGRETLRTAVAEADVFLHNWAPGKAEQWRLGDDALSRVRPDLVYARASGWFGDAGRRRPPGTDYLVQARSGLAARLARPGEPPTPSLLTLTDVFGALVCVEGVLTALVERLRTGRGRRVDSSLFTAARLLLQSAQPLPPQAAPSPDVPLCRDLAALAVDSRFARALEADGCALVRAPWEFAG